MSRFVFVFILVFAESVLADDLSNRATAAFQQGNFSEAANLTEQVLAKTEAEAGSSDPKTAAVLNDLAGIYFSLGKYEQAEDAYRRSLNIRRKSLGDRHLDVARSLNNLAYFLSSRGKAAQAEQMFLEAIEIWKKSGEIRHADYAACLNNLGELYFSQDKLSEALPLFEKALKIREQALGKNHLLVGISSNNLAYLYSAQGRYIDALPLYERSLEVTEKVKGKAHPDVASALNNLAEAAIEVGNETRAEALFKRAIAIREKTAPGSTVLAVSLHGLAELYAANDMAAKAIPLFKRVLDIEIHQVGEQAPETQLVRASLASIYLQTANFSEAAANYREIVKALEINTEAENKAELAAALNNLAYTNVKQGLLKEAEQLYSRVLSMKENMHGASDVAIVPALLNLASILEQQKNNERAKEVYERAKSIIHSTNTKLDPELQVIDQAVSRIENTVSSENTASSTK